MRQSSCQEPSPVNSPTRIEIFDRETTVSLPVRLHPAYIPHVVLGVVIISAWLIDGALAAVSWVAGG
jgi:hypothetical protein